MLLEIPGRGRRIEVVGDEAGHVHQEERPGEAPHGFVVLPVEEDREADRDEEESAVGDGAHEIEGDGRVALEPLG